MFCPFEQSLTAHSRSHELDGKSWSISKEKLSLLGQSLLLHASSLNGMFLTSGMEWTKQLLTIMFNLRSPVYEIWWRERHACSNKLRYFLLDCGIYAHRTSIIKLDFCIFYGICSVFQHNKEHLSQGCDFSEFSVLKYDPHKLCKTKAKIAVFKYVNCLTFTHEQLMIRCFQRRGSQETLILMNSISASSSVAYNMHLKTQRNHLPKCVMRIVYKSIFNKRNAKSPSGFLPK